MIGGLGRDPWKTLEKKTTNKLTVAASVTRSKPGNRLGGWLDCIFRIKTQRGVRTARAQHDTTHAASRSHYSRLMRPHILIILIAFFGVPKETSESVPKMQLLMLSERKGRITTILIEPLFDGVFLNVVLIVRRIEIKRKVGALSEGHGCLRELCSKGV